MALALEKLELEEVKAVNTKYGVGIIGRNEENGIGKCLQSVVNQTLKPERIIFVNDGSTDKTKEIAESITNVEVLEFGENHESWVDSHNLSKVINKAIKIIGNMNELNFIITMGGDTILPPNYAEFIINKMVKHPEIVVAGGKVDGEFSHVPRGTARVTNLNYWRRIGLGYRVKIGFEGYHVMKAASLGLSHRVFDIETTSSKKTGQKYSNSHFYNEGKACKALGYTIPYIFGRAFLMATRRKVHDGFDLLMGYFENENEFYEKELTDYVKKTQNDLLKYRQKEIINRILRRNNFSS